MERYVESKIRIRVINALIRSLMILVVKRAPSK